MGESRTQPRGLGRSPRSSGREAQRVCVLEARRRKWLDEKGVTTWHVTCFASGTSKRQAEDRALDLTVCSSWQSRQRAGDMKSAGEVAGGERARLQKQHQDRRVMLVGKSVGPLGSPTRTLTNRDLPDRTWPSGNGCARSLGTSWQDSCSPWKAACGDLKGHLTALRLDHSLCLGLRESHLPGTAPSSGVRTSRPGDNIKADRKPLFPPRVLFLSMIVFTSPAPLLKLLNVVQLPKGGQEFFVGSIRKMERKASERKLHSKQGLPVERKQTF